MTYDRSRIEPVFCNAEAGRCNETPMVKIVEADMLEKAGPKEFTASGLVPHEWIVSEKKANELRYVVNCHFADNESDSCGLEVFNIACGTNDVSGCNTCGTSVATNP